MAYNVPLLFIVLGLLLFAVTGELLRPPKTAGSKEKRFTSAERAYMRLMAITGRDRVRCEDPRVIWY